MVIGFKSILLLNKITIDNNEKNKAGPYDWYDISKRKLLFNCSSEIINIIVYKIGFFKSNIIAMKYGIKKKHI